MARMKKKVALALGVLSFLTTAAIAAPQKAAKLDLPWAPLPAKAPAPKDNPTTPEKVELGKQLFFDQRLSRDGSVSCNSCHNVMSGGGDSRATSLGVSLKTGKRSAPTVWNSAFHSVQFWDGRAPTLEEQAKGPLINPVEMAMDDHNVVVERVKAIPGYVTQFKKIFGGKDPVTIDNLAKAVAAYERTLITQNSPFDRYMKGDKKAISAQAERGMRTVVELGCIACHNGPNFNGPTLGPGEGQFRRFPTFTDNAYVEKYHLLDDLGRAEVTKNEEEDGHMFRVPTWRNVALTAPYFHNGSVPTLDLAVRVMAKVQLNKDLTDQQAADIVAFLESLTGEFPKQTMPRLPETPGKVLIENRMATASDAKQ